MSRLVFALLNELAGAAIAASVIGGWLWYDRKNAVVVTLTTSNHEFDGNWRQVR